MFSSLRIKVALGFLPIVVSVIFGGYIVYTQSNDITSQFNEIVANDTVRMQALLEIKVLASDISAQTATFRLIPIESYQGEQTPSAVKKYSLLSSLEQFQTELDVYRVHADDDVALVSGARGEANGFFEEMKALQNSILQSSLEIIRAKESGVLDVDLQAQVADLEVTQVRLKTVIDSALEEELEHLDTMRESMTKRALRDTQFSLMLFVLSLIVVTATGVYLTRVVVRPVVMLNKAVTKVGEGDFEQSIVLTQKDEIGDLSRSFNTMSEKLHHTYQDLEKKNGEIENKYAELEKLNKFMVDREIKMVELKKRIKELEAKNSTKPKQV